MFSVCKSASSCWLPGIRQRCHRSLSLSLIPTRRKLTIISNTLTRHCTSPFWKVSLYGRIFPSSSYGIRSLSSPSLLFAVWCVAPSNCLWWNRVRWCIRAFASDPESLAVSVYVASAGLSYNSWTCSCRRVLLVTTSRASGKYILRMTSLYLCRLERFQHKRDAQHRIIDTYPCIQ